MKSEYQIYSNDEYVGKLSVYAIGKNETYFFSYSKEWLKNGYELDPLLPLNDIEFVSKDLWGAFCDISPDRWGRLIQKRKAGSELTNSEYLAGVSDYFRIGALRLKKDGIFISQTLDIPKLTNISELLESTKRVEYGESLEQDIKQLLAPSGSLGGARPKASVVDNGELYIAKFPSIKDEYEQVSIKEQTMLELASMAGINTAKSRLINTVSDKALLVKRFDRLKDERIAYKSAMTLLACKDGDSMDKSYCDIALLLDETNKKELFRRMVFNGLFGNTDDHLRNHGLLYDPNLKVWNLSPAFDITPDSIDYTRQSHGLNFIGFKSLPSIELFYEIKGFFAVDDKEFVSVLDDMLNARDSFENIARKNGISSDNLNSLKNNYMHDDFEMASMLLQALKSKAKYKN